MERQTSQRRMRVVFMGTPDFAVPSLRQLAETHDVVLAITRPDAVRGRGKHLECSPVASVAEELAIPLVKSSRITPELIDQILALNADVVCVAAFGCILPDDVLDAARLGTVNVHASLLPRWRGAAPIQRAILAGDERVGVSIMRVVSELDAGAYCRQASIPVGSASCAELTAALAELGATELIGALAEMDAGSASWVEQDTSQVTYAAKVDKREMRLNPQDSAADNLHRVQASSDAAPARLVVCGRSIRTLEAQACDSSDALATGDVCVTHGRLLLGCSDGAIELLRVRPDGKREMEASAFVAGLHATEPTWASL